MAGRWLVLGIALGVAVGCRGPRTTPEGSDANASGRAVPVDRCQRLAERMEIGAVKRSVPIVHLNHLETAARLDGCVVGIRAENLRAGRACKKKGCPTPPGKPPQVCCNECGPGGMGFGSVVGNIIPYKDGKPWSCRAGMDCDVVKACDVPPGHYDMIGRFSVVRPEQFRLDVEAMQLVPTPRFPAPPRLLEAPCYPHESAPQLRGWSGHFEVERGGAVVLFKGDAKTASDLQRWQQSLGLGGAEMESCEGVLAWWLPGVACPPPAALIDDLRKDAPVIRTACFRPMSVDEVTASCKAGDIPRFRCD